MRCLSWILLTAVAAVLPSCSILPLHDNNITSYPLSTGVTFNISPVYEGHDDRTLYVVAHSVAPNTGHYLHASQFDVSLDERRIQLLLDGVVSGGGSSMLYVPHNEWSIPNLPPGIYQFDLYLQYSTSNSVHDIYSVTIIDADSIIVLPVRADSSNYIPVWDGLG